MTAIGQKVYIDEDVGQDDPSVDGTEETPYRTLLFAHIQHPPPQTDGPQFFTRKSQTGPIPEGGDE